MLMVMLVLPYLLPPVDHRIIWQSPTESSIASALGYYHDRMESALWLKSVQAGIAGISIAATLVKLAKGTTSRILFDGGSLCRWYIPNYNARPDTCIITSPTTRSRIHLCAECITE